jgi:alpha-glucosidase
VKFDFVDYSRAETRRWWAERVKAFLEPGISGITSARWTLGPLPPDVRLEADADLGGPDSGLRYQNILDTQFARATRDGFGGEASHRRPFVMIDARAIGAQRYTGALIDWPEQDPSWPRMFIDAALNTSMSGQPLVGTLIKPPFQGEGTDANLCWIGTAAAFPIAAGSFFLPGEFADFPEPAQTVIRLAMERRARLIPYLYTLCFASFMEGEPMLRPLFFDDPANPALREDDSGFLVGQNLLVMPRPSPGQHAPVPLKGSWRKLDFGDSADPYLPDLYLRPGAIIPLGPVISYPGEKPLDPITIVANPDESGLAVGTLYEDAGDGYEFLNNQGRRIAYRITKEDGAYLVRLAGHDFGLPVPERRLDVRILTDQGVLAGSGSEKGTVKIDAAVPNKDTGQK